MWFSIQGGGRLATRAATGCGSTALARVRRYNRAPPTLASASPCALGSTPPNAIWLVRLRSPVTSTSADKTMFVACFGRTHLRKLASECRARRTHRPDHPPALVMPRYLRASAGRLRDIARGLGLTD